jgi:hypothetical protein
VSGSRTTRAVALAFGLSALLAGPTLYAEDPPPSPRGALLERFRQQLDRDGDLIGLWLVDRYQRIWDEENPLASAPFGLRGSRSMRPSPFPEEAGRVFYFCGFDQHGVQGAGATGPAAWIYRAALPDARGDRR